MTQVIILCLALFIDRLGDPPTAWHPVGWMGRFLSAGISLAESLFRTDFRTGSGFPVSAWSRAAQVAFGAFWVLTGAIGAAGAAWLVFPALRPWSEGLFILASAVILKTTFSLAGLAAAAGRVKAALAAGDIREARHAVARDLVSRETSALDEARVVSAAVESVAENLVDSVVAPLLFYAACGLPGALAYRFVNTADAMIGYRGPTEYVGKAAARLDDLLNLLPARLSGLLVVAAARLTGEDWRGSWRTLLRDRGRTASPNAGWPMSAMAGALGVELSKVGCYNLGKARNPLTPSTLGRSVRILHAAAALWFAGLAAGIGLARS
ncbi:MAG: adenosylcobinamide-phosphate synthase CbiB [Nitrospirota bacterium]